MNKMVRNLLAAGVVSAGMMGFAGCTAPCVCKPTSNDCGCAKDACACADCTCRGAEGRWAIQKPGIDAAINAANMEALSFHVY